MVDLNRLGGHIFLAICVRVGWCSTSLRQFLLDNRLELAIIDSAVGAVVLEVTVEGANPGYPRGGRYGHPDIGWAGPKTPRRTRMDYSQLKTPGRSGLGHYLP